MMMLEWIRKLIAVIGRVGPQCRVKRIATAERTAYMGDVIVVDLPE